MCTNAILDCSNPGLAGRQFSGMLNDFFLWPWIMGRDALPVPAEALIEETVEMFLRRYRRPSPKAGRGAGG